MYDAMFGHGASYAGAGHELLSVRVAGAGSLPPPPLKMKGDALVRAGEREVVFDDPANPVATTIWRTSFPAPGSRVDGPCIIEFPGQSAVVPPGGRASADDFGNLHIELAS